MLAIETVTTRTDVQDFLWTESTTHLIDVAGHEISPGSLHDKVVAVGFFNTQCSAPCALRLLDLTKVAAALPPAARQRVVFLALTGDPAHDTPDELGRFAAGMNIPSEAVRLLASDASSISRLYRSIRWRQGASAPDDVPPTVFVFDRLGQIAMRYDASPVQQGRLVRDLTSLVSFSHGVGSAPDASTASR